MRNMVRGLLVCAALASATASATGIFVSAPNRVDVAYDEQRDLLYISSGGDVLRYSVAQGQFLSNITLGGSLRGIDLSPDGNTLAVADADSTQTKLWVFSLDLNNLVGKKLEVTKQDYGSGTYYESGSWAVSYAYDGSLFMTSSFPGSGWTPMRRFSAAGVSQEIASVRQDTMVSASGNRKVISFAESNISGGEWGRVDAVSGQFVERGGYLEGTSWFNYEIATNVDGTQYAIPTYGGTFVYDRNYRKVATLGQYAGPQPVGVAYDPVDSLAYFPWAGSSEVRVYDMDVVQEVGRYDVGKTFGQNGNSAYQSGRTRLSGDGSLLMVTVDGGVQIVRMYAPLTAKAIAVRVPPRLKSSIVLKGSIGNGGKLQYEVAKQPSHGRVTIVGNRAIYSPDAGYTGADAFTYRAKYGRAKSDAVASVTVSNFPR